MGMDREKWLAIRNTPRKLGNEKMIHQSTDLVHVKDDKTHVTRVITRHKGNTFRRTQNKG